MEPHRIGSPEIWLAERTRLLAEERVLTHAMARLRAVRRALPWVEVMKPYRFAAPGGDERFAELFARRGQLAVYHFMLPPGGDRICPSCAFLTDHVDGARRRFEQADLSFGDLPRDARADRRHRLQPRLRRALHARGDRGRRAAPQLRALLLSPAGPAQRQPIRARCCGSDPPHLFHLRPRGRAAARRAELARPRAEGSQRGGHDELGAAARRIRRAWARRLLRRDSPTGTPTRENEL